MDKFFKISERGSNVRTEIIAGLTTFFAMAYIVVTNPNQIVSFNHLAPDADPAFQQIWNAVYVASILAAIIGTLLMALYAKMPFAQACGMGLNSFFFVSFILPEIISGGDIIKGYHAGLVIILVSGFVFLLFSVTGLRVKVAKALPDCLKKAIPAGIGLFIAFLGFQNVGIIQTNQYTLVQFVDIHGALKAGAFFADVEGAKAFMPAILAFLGLLVIAILEKHNVKGGVLISIAGISVLYYLLSGTTPTFDMSQIGQTFKDFGSIGITGVFQADAWKRAFTGSELGGIFSAIMLIVTFCLVDMFDTIGTLVGTASRAGMTDKDGNMPNMKEALLSDAVGTVAGACCGTSTVTTFVESASGVEAGGRTGLTSLTAAFMFLACMFIAPVAAVIPAAATSSALIYVGILMLQGLKNVDFDDLDQVVPVFLMLLAMPISGSIGHGIGIAMISYTVIKVFSGRAKDVSVLTYVISLLFIIKFFAVV